MRSFPNTIIHCIEWARADGVGSFTTLFTNAADEVNACVEGFDEFVVKLKKNQNTASQRYVCCSCGCSCG